MLIQANRAHDRRMLQSSSERFSSSGWPNLHISHVLSTWTVMNPTNLSRLLALDSLVGFLNSVEDMA